MDSKHQARFEAAKLRRALQSKGVPFSFFRNSQNEFNEPEEDTQLIAKLTGIYHETISYAKEERSDGGNIQKKPSPMILCKWEDAESIQRHDFVMIHGRRYEVHNIKNVAELGVAADISLEVSIPDGDGI